MNCYHRPAPSASATAAFNLLPAAAAAAAAILCASHDHEQQHREQQQWLDDGERFQPTSAACTTTDLDYWEFFAESERTPCRNFGSSRAMPETETGINAKAPPLSLTLADVSSGIGSVGFKGTSLLSDIGDEIDKAMLAPSPSVQHPRSGSSKGKACSTQSKSSLVQQHRRRSSRRKGGKRPMKENRESWDRKLTFFKAVKDSYEILSASSNSKSHNKRIPLMKVAYNHVAKSVSKESEDGVFRNYNVFKKWLSNAKYAFSEANKARELNLRNKNWLYQKLLENEVLSFPPPEPSASIHSQ